MQEPIIILGIPRTGSSMISGIFAAHGVFFGKCKEPDESNPKGYFENIAISSLLKRKEEITPEKVKKILENEGYENSKPWAVKHAPGPVKYWKGFNPKFVCCQRNLKDNFKSYRKFFNISYKRFKEFYKQKIKYMESLGGIFVYSDEIVNGNYNSLERAFNFCNLTFNSQIASNFIDIRSYTIDKNCSLEMEKTK